MAETLYRCQMYYESMMSSSSKVWGAVVLKTDSSQYQYASAWGRHDGFISLKRQPAEGITSAVHRYAKATREKVNEGYKSVAAEYDFNLKCALDNILIDQETVTQALDKTNQLLETLPVVETAKEKIAKPKPKSSSIPLPDLPCTGGTCGHWLNVHATPEETGRYRLCLVGGCSCEQYRRLCNECGYTSVNWSSHAPSCATGKIERAGLNKPQQDTSRPTIAKPTPPPIYVRQPRRIMHLISDDD